jgi:hypothetical protein
MGIDSVDMCKFMKKLVETTGTGEELTVEERNLLSVAFKNVIGARRASWRTLQSDEYKSQELVKTYREMIEDELEAICKEVLDLVKNFLVPAAKFKGGTESVVFYLKMFVLLGFDGSH